MKLLVYLERSAGIVSDEKNYEDEEDYCRNNSSCYFKLIEIIDTIKITCSCYTQYGLLII